MSQKNLNNSKNVKNGSKNVKKTHTKNQNEQNNNLMVKNDIITEKTRVGG